MQGVVSLLDDRHYARVEAIWEELGQKFDVRGMYVVTYPHFSFQVAEQYDDGACETALRELAARTRPFRVRTAGLGVFTVASPILYIPDEWVPHITLAHGDIDPDKLAEIVRTLSRRNFHWELTVNNLALIYDTGKEQGVRCRFNFGCAST